jgi:hypothetical protein
MGRGDGTFLTENGPHSVRQNLATKGSRSLSIKNSIPCDVVAHGSAKEPYVLGQIADLIAEIVAVPGEDVSAVEADGAMLRLGEPYDSTW